MVRLWLTAGTGCRTFTDLERRTVGQPPVCSRSTCFGSTVRICGRYHLTSGGDGCGWPSGDARKALRFSEHLQGDGEALPSSCAMGLEGIVSKRRDCRYRSGRSLTWLKIKNPHYKR